jgi:hypothetical protein
MKMTVFWVVVPCSLVEVCQRFKGACYLHHQGDEYSTIQKRAVFNCRSAFSHNKGKIFPILKLYDMEMYRGTEVKFRAFLTSLQVTVVIRAFAIRVFAYPLFYYYEGHQYPIRGQILKLVTCVESSPGL